MTIISLIKEAKEFEKEYTSFKTRNEKILASRKAKEIVLSINNVYKNTKDENLMNIMKRITVLKQKLEKRLKGRIS